MSWSIRTMMKSDNGLPASALIYPDWPAPANVRSIQTTRRGGLSAAPYDSFNLGDHVGDDPLRVAANRQRLANSLPSEPIWMTQIHGTHVVHGDTASCQPAADAMYATQAGTVCAVMTADCLPVLLCDRQGTVVAAVHAGWRGLLDGVIEAAIAAMPARPENLLAWLGPAIGPQAFEVGTEVRQAFIEQNAGAGQAFVPGIKPDKWLADIYALACQRLAGAGVTRTYGGNHCTYTELDPNAAPDSSAGDAGSSRFFSFRRDGRTGRMASLIWLE